MGVIALFVAVLPRLAIGGRELFFAEAPGPTDEKLTPQIRQTALALWRLYAALTALQMVGADARRHVAVRRRLPRVRDAGGRRVLAASAVDRRLRQRRHRLDHHRLHVHRRRELRAAVPRGARERVAVAQDEEFRAYVGIVLVATRGAGGVPGARRHGRRMDAMRHGAFQVISILTTTGFASVDFQLWSDQAKMVLLVLMFIGGCAGSAAGGPKVVRHVLMARVTLRELKRTLHPRAVLPVKLGGRVVPEDILRDVQVFMLFYLLMFAVGAAVVVALGADIADRHHRQDRLPGQHRPRIRADRADGQLRRPASGQQDRADAR